MAAVTGIGACEAVALLGEAAKGAVATFGDGNGSSARCCFDGVEGLSPFALWSISRTPGTGKSVARWGDPPSGTGGSGRDDARALLRSVADESEVRPRSSDGSDAVINFFLSAAAPFQPYEPSTVLNRVLSCNK